MDVQMTRQDQMASWFSRMLQSLGAPRSEEMDTGNRRRASLVAGIALLLAVLSVLGTTGSIAANGYVTQGSFLQVILAVTSIPAYFLARTRRYMIAAWMLAVTLFVLGYADAFVSANPEQAILFYSPFAFLLAVGLFSWRQMSLLTLLSASAALFLPLFGPQFDMVISMTVFGLLLSVGCLGIAVVAVRDSVEHAHLEEVRLVNQQMKRVNDQMEQRVNERTLDLTLAAEVGRRISEVQDMDALLHSAVSLIGERFHLYYTQVYLVDRAGRSLILRAGTGEVGKELLRLNHRLPLDLASINGSAALERHAILVADTAASPTFRPHPLLPNTRSEMAVPLVAGDRVLGVLDLQSIQPGGLDEHQVPVFETMAAQLATALLNAELFERVERSYKELEARSRVSVRQGWDEYLDGIEQKDRVGYAFDLLAVTPLESPVEPVQDDCAMYVPIQVAGEPVGAFRLAGDEPWLSADREVANQVAKLVAQRVENLRLLQQADRFRREAEGTLRRVTHAEWDSYLTAQSSDALAFQYAGGEVRPASLNGNGHNKAVTFEITVQDEPVGALALEGVEHLPAEDAELAETISDVLGAHLENIRLYTTAQQELTERQRAEQALKDSLMQRETILNQTARLYAASRRFSDARSLDDIVTTVCETLALPDFNRGALMLFEMDEQGTVRSIEVAGNWHNGIGLPPFPVGVRYTEPAVLDSFIPLIARETMFRDETDEHARQEGIVSGVTLPLWIGERFLGLVAMQSEVQHHFSEDEKRPAPALAQQAAVAVESRLLLEETLASEARFRETSGQLANALDAAKMANWEFDVPAGEFVFNDTFYRFLRTTVEEQGGYRMPLQVFASKFVHPEDGQQMGAGMGEALSTDDPNFKAEMTSRQVLADGDIRWVVTRVAVEKDETGRTLRIIGANQDITEQRLASEQIESQRRVLQAVLDNMPVAVIAKDAKTYTFTLWNQAAERLFGIPNEAVIGKTDYDLYPHEQAEAFRASDMEVLENRALVDIPEEKAIGNDGEIRILHTVKAPVVDEDNQPVLLLVVAEDITLARKSQELIAKRATELARVAEVATTVATIQNPEEMLQTVVDLTKQDFGLYHAHVYLLDETGKRLVLTKGAGEVGRKMAAEGRAISIETEKSLVARAARTRSGVIVNDVRLDPDFLANPLLTDTRSEMAVPMIAGDRLLGVLDIQDEVANRFSHEDANILTTLAAQVAVSLQNARSYARAQRQAEREALINSISERIQATNSVENALQVAVREIGRALGAQHAAVRLGLERKSDEA